MAQYEIPGTGKKLNIPDNLDPLQRERLAGAIKRTYGIDINETTGLGRAKEFAKGIPREAVAAAQNIPIGISALFDMGNDSPKTQFLRERQEEWRTEGPFAGDPAYQDLYTTKLGAGLGSFIPYLGAGIAGRALTTRGVGSKLPRLLQPDISVPLSLAVPGGISEQVDFMDQARAEGKEIGPITEILSELGGGVIGATELLPIMSLLKRVPKNALRYSDVRRMLASASRQAGEEALQETLAGVSQRLLARGLYSDDLPITESVWDDMTVGGGVGFIADLAVNSVSRRSRGRDYLRDNEQRARDNRVNLQSKGKWERGIEQGVLEEVQDEPLGGKPDVPIPPLVGVEPNLQVVETPNGEFIVVDLNATERDKAVLNTFEKETDAILDKNKRQTNFLRKKLKVDIDNALYALGLINSSSALDAGNIITDPNIARVNLQSLIAFDSKLTEEQKKDLAKERKEAGFFGKNVPSEMIERKKALLEKTGKYLKAKGVDLKASFSMAEAKKVLSKKDYNFLLNDMAAIVNQNTEKDGQPSIVNDKDKPNVNLKYIREIAAAKNIELDFKDPAVQYAAKIWTGESNMSKTRNRAVKELFLARLYSLPSFNTKTKFPDFRPRTYTALDVANFVASVGSRKGEFTVKSLLKDGVTAKDKAATEQFISDLVTSGRAEKIEGTNKYRIRKNHEYEIARRSEGFGETPSQYEERLRKEGMPEETIQMLVEKERIKQRNVLPPEEVEPKLIKFNEAVEEGRTNVFARELQSILNRRGLSETGVIVSNDILSTSALAKTKDGKIVFDPRPLRETEEELAVEGEYDRDTDMIFISLNSINPDGNLSKDEIKDRLEKVLDHEMIHAFREKDLITEKEYQYLRKEVKRKKVSPDFDSRFKGRSFYQRAKTMNETRPDLVGRNEELKEELYIEEAIAEMFRARNFKPAVAPKADGIIDKIAEFFRSMGQAMRTAGFRRSSEVFSAIEEGRVGARERGEIRTLRELDKMRPDTIDAVLAQEFEETEEDGTETIVDPVDPVTVPPPMPWEDVKSDKDRITGVVLKPGEYYIPGSPISGVFDQNKLNSQQAENYRKSIIAGLEKENIIRRVSRTSNKYEAVNSDTAAVEMTKWLRDNAPNEDYRIIASKTYEQLNKLSKVGAKFPMTFTSRKAGWSGRVKYNPFGGRIFEMDINNSPSSIESIQRYEGEQAVYRNNGVNFETLLHEALHTATVAHIRSLSSTKSVRVKKAYEELTRIQDKTNDYIREKTVEWNKLISEGKREELLTIKSEQPLTMQKYIDALLSENRRIINNWKAHYWDYKINGIQSGNPTKDVSEFITFGLTNREQQEFLESIPYAPKSKKSIWNKFVESVRKIIGLPAKSDTVLSSFLGSASKITDLGSLGLEGLGEQSAQGPPITLTTVTPPSFSRGRRFTVPQNVQIVNESIINDNGIIIRPDTSVVLDETTDDNNNQYKGYSIFKDNKKIGQTIFSSDVNGPVTLSDIVMLERGKRLGRSVVETIMSASPSKELEISNIVPRSLGFWESLGTKLYNKNNPDEALDKDEILETDVIDGVLKLGAISPPRFSRGKRFTPEQEQILNQLSEIEGRIMPVVSEINQEGGVMSPSNLRRLIAKRDNLYKEKDTLQKRFDALPSPDPEQTLLFSRGRKLGKEQNPYDVKRKIQGKTLSEVMDVIAKEDKDLSIIARKVKEQIKKFERQGFTYGLEVLETRMPRDGKTLKKDDLSPRTRELIKNPDAKSVFKNNFINGRASGVTVLGDPKRSATGGMNRNVDIYLNNTVGQTDGLRYRTILHEAIHGVTISLLQIGAASRGANPFIKKADEAFNDFKNIQSVIKNHIDSKQEEMNQVYLEGKKEWGDRLDREGYLKSKGYSRLEIVSPSLLPIYPDEGIFREKGYDIVPLVELVTYGLTDIEMQEFMESIPYDAKGKTTVWNEFVESIRKILGLPAKQNTVLSEVLRAGDSILSADSVSINNALVEFQNAWDGQQFEERKRFGETGNTSKNIKLREATEKAEELVRKTPRGDIPIYNVNASDVALEAAIDFNEDATAQAPDDIPRYSRPTMPDFIDDIAKRIGQPTYKHKKSWGARLLDETDDSVSIRKAFSSFRTAIVDKLDPIAKRMVQLGEDNDETRLLNTYADTAAIAALRLADRARGVFQGLLMRGYATDQIEGEDSLTNVAQLPISTKYNPFIDGDTGYGGLMQITAPLFMDPSVDLEGVFAVYAKLKRQASLNKQGKEIASPITPQDLESIAEIETRFKQVVEVWNNYQNWNNKLIEFAESKGLLSPEQSELWREHSSYYPFYRDMVDETDDITAPRIGGGMLPNNPLNITMKGSEEQINVPPLEAIARNSLSILTAAMKNDGAAKLMRDFVDNGMAEKVTAKEASGKISVPVFENGNKEFYLIEDYEVYEALRGIGGANTDFITRALQFPASILRDTVTRDPGFIMVNLLRDTLSSAITAGNVGLGEGNFTPIIDTFKGMAFDDMADLERFGVIGGYDFANDEGDVVDLMARARRAEGLSPDNGITPESAFYKLWDGLGAMTTKSDGATRLGVYRAVYNDMKQRGASEAQAQSEAAYQALEIINFGRRGNSVLFRYLTSAIPFLNARIQGLDVLWRSASGQYSAIEKLEEGETLKDVQSRIIRGFWTRGGMLFGITALYYMMVSDTDEYKEVKREVRDDNWLIPTPFDYTIKIPIPFEVGMLFKAIPERLIDETVGRQVEKNPMQSIKRQLGTSADLPFFGGDVSIQLVKPIFEAVTNKNSWTNTEIVPYYKSKEMPAYQAGQSTNEVARLLGEFLNISPMKIEHILQGYTGTLGGYLLDLMDVTARSITGTPLMPPNINSIPVINRLLLDNDKSGGLQQSFYELREEVQGATATLNDLKDQKRFDELATFREHHRGLFKVKGQVNAINRFMQNWRKQRDRLLRRTDLSAMVKADMLKELEARRDKRLAIVPALRDRADVPRISFGN